MNSYEQKLSQGQSIKQNLLRRGTVPPSNVEGVEQKASKPAWLLGRAVPPTMCTVMGGTGTVILSQTQKILPKQETDESHGNETVLRSAKSKSNYLQTIENLEILENCAIFF